jgi:mono/diheme cytochrome c family protein
MRTVVRWSVSLAVSVGICGAALAGGQEPPAGRGAPGGGGQGRGGAPAAPPSTVRQIPRSPVVDQPAHDRGRALWAMHCIDCHGSQARGSDTGPNIIRTKTVNFDRSAEAAGSVLGPFLKAGHPTQSQKPSASFTEEEVVALANFLRQKVNDTMRGSALFTVGDIVVGDAKAGEAYFNGEGRCTTCHTATERNLAGIATRIPEPVDLQQRMLFPGGGGRGRGGRGATPAAPGAAPAVDRNAITVTIAPAAGQSLSGTLVEESDFYITIRQADGSLRAVRRTAGLKVTRVNPLQAHIDFLDRLTDKQIHDLVAYLVTLK